MRKITAFLLALVITAAAFGQVTTDSTRTGIGGGTATAFTATTFGALPACAAGTNGSIYRATDIGDAPGALLICNGTRWKPLSGRARLGTLAAPVTGLTNTESISLQALMPAAAFAVNDHIEIWIAANKSGTTDTGSVTIRMGTSGTTADAAIYSAIQVMTAANQTSGIAAVIKLTAATTAQRIGGTALTGSYGGGGGSTPAGVTISNISNPLYVDVAMLSGGATNTVGLYSAYIDWIAP
jgi:hypothetical protein